MTLYELCSPYFSSEVMVTLKRSVRGHLVKLTKFDMHLIKYHPGHMISFQVAYTSGTNNSYFQEFIHLDDHITSRYVTSEFKPF